MVVFASIRLFRTILIMLYSDIVRAVGEAIIIVSEGRHDPKAAHTRIREFYNWASVAERTEVVYENILQTEPIDLYTRMRR